MEQVAKMPQVHSKAFRYASKTKSFLRSLINFGVFVMEWSDIDVSDT